MLEIELYAKFLQRADKSAVEIAHRGNWRQWTETPVVPVIISVNGFSFSGTFGVDNLCVNKSLLCLVDEHFFQFITMGYSIYWIKILPVGTI